jgi:hypothetical protein
MDSVSRGRAVGQAQRILFLFLCRDRNAVATRENPSADSQALPELRPARCKSLTPLNKLHVLLGPMVDEVNPPDSTVDMAGARKPVFTSELAS